MLAKTGKVFDNPDYFFEPKWDGLRALLFFQNGKLELQNRNQRDATDSYPELQHIKSTIKAKTAIIDGEIVVLRENGVPDFGSLQNRFGVEDLKHVRVLSKTNPVTYVAFDLLHLNGRDIVNEPLVARKKHLRSIIMDGPYLLYGEHIERYGIRFFQRATRNGLEGTIAKEAKSHYIPGLRTDYWVKIKKTSTIDCVVVGWTEGEGARSVTFGSLILAAYDADGKLRHMGNVGGGFSDKALQNLKPKLAGIEKKTETIDGPVDSPTPVTWVKPKIVVEVVYMSLTHDGRLRFPRFSRLRTDKDPSDCKISWKPKERQRRLRARGVET